MFVGQNCQTPGDKMPCVELKKETRFIYTTKHDLTSPITKQFTIATSFPNSYLRLVFKCHEKSSHEVKKTGVGARALKYTEM